MVFVDLLAGKKNSIGSMVLKVRLECFQWICSIHGPPWSKERQTQSKVIILPATMNSPQDLGDLGIFDISTHSHQRDWDDTVLKTGNHHWQSLNQAHYLLINLSCRTKILLDGAKELVTFRPLL